MFQCSSASRKFLNRKARLITNARCKAFQCSSASRKFLNRTVSTTCAGRGCPFQCSSASRKFLNRFVEVEYVYGQYVSVLFSEPKIPQSYGSPDCRRCTTCFSALQRAENSSIFWRLRADGPNIPFQCSSASRKFLN